MVTTLNMTLLVRRDNFTEESKKSYVLQAGEPGYCTSSKVFKIGDGSTTWENLAFANKAEIEALIQVIDNKIAALGDTYATDAEVRVIKEALEDDIEAVDAKFADYRTSAAQDAIDATFALKTDVATEFAKYTTTEAQTAIDAEQDRRLGVIEGDYLKAADIANFETKENVKKVADDLAAYETSNDARVEAIENEIDAFGDIVSHNASEFETAGAAAEAEGRINETLKSYYTKTEADAAFTTPAEVIAEVNKALSEVSSADTIESITTLVNYVNENAADLTGLITEVYGSAEMTGDSRLDTIEAKAAMGITADDIAPWNVEKGVKAVVDANKATWDKAGTALQAADLADYAKTADVVTNDEFTQFETANTEAIGKKLDKATYDAYIAGKELSDADLKKYAEDEADIAQAAAEKVATDFNTAMDARVVKLENNDAGYATGTEVSTSIDTFYTNRVAPIADRVTVLEEDLANGVGVMEVAPGKDIEVSTVDGVATVNHKTFVTGEYTKDPATSDKTGDQYFFTGVTVDNGHITGANVKSLASVLEAMSFVFDGGNASN